MTVHVAAVEETVHQTSVEELTGGIRELGDEEREGLLDLLLEKGCWTFSWRRVFRAL